MLTLKTQLKNYLLAQGLTAAQLARRSGVPKQSISGWLAGNNPRDVRQIKKLSDALGTTVDNLMFGDSLGQPGAGASPHSFNDQWLSGVFEVKIRRIK